MKILIGFIGCIGLLWSSPAEAQFGPNSGLGDIFEDIIGAGKGPTNQALIDNIPVRITLDQNMDVSGQILIVSAHAPPPKSGTFSEPQLLGQTHLLLTGLSLPMNLVVAAPAPVTETIDFARIEAKIIDGNGNTVLESREDGYYRGTAQAQLVMVQPGYQSRTPGASAPISGIETIEGKVRLSEKTDMFRGSLLTVQLVESGLAGGLSTLIAAETFVDIDQKTAPFDFTLDRGLRPGSEDINLALNAWITDWAGRKSHVMAQPVPYNGPDRKYSLTLDKYEMTPPPADRLTPNAAQTVVSGEARFDAYKGLPAGSRMTVTLSRAVGAPGTTRALATRTIMLDGLSGYVKFDLVADSTNFDPLIPAPVLNIRITDPAGRLFFSSANTPANSGMNIVQLTPSSTY